MSKRRSSIGNGTPLADAGVPPTLERRVSLGAMVRSPMIGMIYEDDEELDEVRRHTIANEFSGKTIEPIAAQLKRASYSVVENSITNKLKGTSLMRNHRSNGIGGGRHSSWNNDDENDENMNANANNIAGATGGVRRYSLMPSLDAFEEESQEISKDTTRDSDASTGRASTSPSKVGRNSHVSLSKIALDEKNLFAALALSASPGSELSNSRKSRGSLLSQLSVLDMELDEVEDPAGPNNRLSIAEVLRSFRNDPTATENAFAMVKMTGKLLPADFRKFVKAFKSPSFKSKPAHKVAPVESIHESIGLRSWQPRESTRSDSSPQFHQEHVVHSTSTLGGKSTMSSSSISDDVEEMSAHVDDAPWTENELRRASAVLQLGTSMNNEGSVFNMPSSDTSLEQSLDKIVNGTVVTLTPFEMLEAELETLRAQFKQTQSMTTQLQTMQKSVLSDMRSTHEHRSTAQAVETLRALEDTRLAYEMDIARRMINRLGACKFRLQDRREARLRKLEEIDDMDEQMSLHVERRNSGVYGNSSFQRHCAPSSGKDYSTAPHASELPSPGPYSRFGGLPQPSNPGMLLGSAFIKPQPQRAAPTYYVNSSSSSRSGASVADNNDAYGNGDDYDYAGGGGADYGGYTDNDYIDHRFRATAAGGGKKAPKIKRATVIRREPKPIFKASPNTRYGQKGGLNFIALDSPISENDEGVERSADHEDFINLDEEYRKEKRLAAAIRREEARRQRCMQESDQEDGDEQDEGAENNENYHNRRLNTFKSQTEKRKVGRPKGTLNASKASAMRKVGSKVPGRGRGRPPKSSYAKPVPQIDSNGEPKRGRGRPRKVVDVDADGNVIVAAPIAKKAAVNAPRGRRTKAEIELAAAHAGDRILSAREIRKLEKKIKKSKISAATGALGEPVKKRLVSSYAIFCKATRPEVVEANPEQQGCPQEILRLLAAKWRECNMEEKEEWQDKANKENAANVASMSAKEGEVSEDSDTEDEEEENNGEDQITTAQSALNEAHENVESALPVKAPVDVEGSEIADIVNTEKRKRGRPQKVIDPADSSVEQRKRGRPKKEKVFVCIHEDESADPDVVSLPLVEKKKRGRPPKNATIVNAQTHDMEMEEKVDVQSEKEHVQKAAVDVEEYQPSSLLIVPTDKVDAEDVTMSTTVEGLSTQVETTIGADENEEVNVNIETVPVLVELREIEEEEALEETDMAAASIEESAVFNVKTLEGEKQKKKKSKKSKKEKNKEEGMSVAAALVKKSKKVLQERERLPSFPLVKSKISRMSGVGTIATTTFATDNQHVYFSSADNSLDLSMGDK